MNSSVHEHVHSYQTTKCCAHEIKLFHSIWLSFSTRVSV